MSMGKRLAIFTLSDVDSSGEIRRGEFKIDAGKVMCGVMLHVSGTLNKSDAGTTTLTAADKDKLLTHLQVQMEHGPIAFPRVPFQDQGLDRIRVLHRECYQKDLPLFTDTTNGLGKTIAASGDTTVEFWVYVPTGKFWKVPELRAGVGMGKSQLENAYFRAKRTSTIPTLPTATTTKWKASTAITVEVFPDLETGGDEEFIPPEYREAPETGAGVVMPDGLPLLFGDRNAAHASTSLTKFNLTIDGEPIAYQADPADTILDYRNQKPDEDISDKWTLLYALKPQASLNESPSGVLAFEQVSQDLSTILWFSYAQPVLAEEAWKARIAEAATKRNAVIRATTNWASKGYLDRGYKHATAAFLGASYFPEGSPEYQKFFGWLAQRDQAGKFVVDLRNPAAQVANLARRAQGLKGNRQSQAAESLVRSLTATIPGGVQSGNGFVRGTSEAGRRIRAQLGL